MHIISFTTQTMQVYEESYFQKVENLLFKYFFKFLFINQFSTYNRKKKKRARKTFVSWNCAFGDLPFLRFLFLGIWFSRNCPFGELQCTHLSVAISRLFRTKYYILSSICTITRILESANKSRLTIKYTILGKK